MGCHQCERRKCDHCQPPKCGDRAKSKCATLTSASSTFFTPVTHNWKSVSKAVVVPKGTVYGGTGGGPDNEPVVLYTVPKGRCALLLSTSDDQGSGQTNSYAVRDPAGTYYLVVNENEVEYERFVYLDQGDAFVVWGNVAFDFSSAAVFIEFDKKGPDGSFYKILRLSTTSETDEISYTIPSKHSAVLCPNVLPIGSAGDAAAESIVLGADGSNNEVSFKVINTINGLDFTSFDEIDYDVVPFVTEVMPPKLTAFSAGDSLKLVVEDNEENNLVTMTTALFLKRNGQ